MTNVIIESKDTQDIAAGNSVVFDRPAGLEVGDLMVATCFLASGNLTPDDISAPAGWTAAYAKQVITDSPKVLMQGFYKIAASGDVAASTFTFASDDVQTGGGGEMYRISGFRAADPIGGTGKKEQLNTNGAELIFDSAFTPDQQRTFYILSYVHSDTNSVSLTSPVIDATNPTWLSQFTDVASAETSAYIFTGVVTSTDEITKVNQTVTGSTLSTDWVVSIIAINDDGNSSGTNTFFSTPTETFVAGGIADAIGGTNLLTEATGEVVPQEGIGTTPTQWTNETKPSTTWVNETK